MTFVYIGMHVTSQSRGYTRVNTYCIMHSVEFERTYLLGLLVAFQAYYPCGSIFFPAACLAVGRALLESHSFRRRRSGGIRPDVLRSS